MKSFFFPIILLIIPLLAFAQNGAIQLPPTQEEMITTQPRPRYCDEFPLDEYSTKGGGRPPLPQFQSNPTICYKIQVAVLRKTDPFNYPMHRDLHARWRPCEEVWVVESKLTYCDRREAERMRRQFQNLGYSGAYLTQLVSYE